MDGESQARAGTLALGEKDKYLFEAHIAEYNALTARNTQWSSVQSNAWMMLIVGLALMANFWVSKPSYLNVAIWGTGMVVQVALIGVCFATQEIYRNVYYIEHDLHKLIESLLGKQYFWGYEYFLCKKSRRKVVLSDVAPLALGLATLALVINGLAHYIGGFHRLFGSILNSVLSLTLFAQTWDIVTRRKKFEEAAKQNFAP